MDKAKENQMEIKDLRERQMNYFTGDNCKDSIQEFLKKISKSEAINKIIEEIN